MKRSLPFLFVVLMAVTGCSKIKDATAIKVNTNFDVDFPVVASDVKTTSAAFSVTEDLSLADNGDLDEYTSRINDINLSNVVITITGLTEGQTIHSLSLDAAGIGNILTESNLTMTNNSFTPEISASLLNQLGDKLLKDKKLTLTVSGETNEPMTFVVNCNMDARVEVETL